MAYGISAPEPLHNAVDRLPSLLFVIHSQTRNRRAHLASFPAGAFIACSTAFRPQAPDAEPFCDTKRFRLKAALRTDYPRSAHMQRKILWTLLLVGAGL